LPIYEHKNNKVLFIHIPKTAGSSINSIFRKLGWSESFVVSSRPADSLTHYKSTPQHLHASVLKSIFNFQEFDMIISIVRNPFDRIKSEYYWQLSQQITSLNVADWLSHAFAKYNHNKYIFDNHIRHQSDFIIDDDNQIILKLEDDGINKLKSMILNKTNNTFSLQKYLMKYNLLSIHHKKSIKVVDIELAFEKERSRIQEFYESDYKRFNYPIVDVT
jgi:hypothetical protein